MTNDVQILSRANNFDLLRLLAASQVLINHINEFLKLPLDPNLAYCISLFPGVAVFFVISGFLVTKSYVEGHSDLKRYFAKRALRIYPALIVNVLLINLLLYCVGSFHLSDVLSWPFIRHHLIQLPSASWWYAGWYFNGYPYRFPNYNGGQYPNPVLWTLTVEITFYLVLPLVIGRVWERSRENHSGYSLVLWAIISLAFAVWMSYLAQAAPNSNERAILMNMVLPHLWIFLIGVGMYIYWDKISCFCIGRFPLWLAAYCALSYVNYKVNKISILDYNMFDTMILVRMILLAFCVLGFAFTWPRMSSFLHGNDVSYGLYLNHFLIVWIFGYLGIVGHSWLWPVVGGLSMLAGILSWRLVERPMLRLKKRLG